MQLIGLISASPCKDGLVNELCMLHLFVFLSEQFSMWKYFDLLLSNTCSPVRHTVLPLFDFCFNGETLKLRTVLDATHEHLYTVHLKPPRESR